MAAGSERDLAALRRLRGPLVRWYRRHARDLPWRRTCDPYAVWVSEIMLQQTRVATVIPYYESFVARFPDVAHLASASEEEVLACWSGLGYYRRARALHAGAIAVMERHGGRIPGEAEGLRALPGIGRYTAGAIASIAFDRNEAVLDGNVRRVLARLLTLDGRRLGRAREERRLWEAADALARGDRPGRLNQALMELGALVCTSHAPGCRRCPLRGGCAAAAAGNPEAYPAPRARAERRSVAVSVAWIARAGRILLERPAADNPLRGTWDLPAVEVASDRGSAAIRRKLRRAGLEVEVGRCLALVRHGIMNRRLALEVLDCRLRRGRVAGRDGLRWVRPDELATTAHSGATRKVAAVVEG